MQFANDCRLIAALIRARLYTIAGNLEIAAQCEILTRDIARSNEPGDVEQHLEVLRRLNATRTLAEITLREHEEAQATRLAACN